MWKTWCVFRVKALFSNFSDPAWSDWMSFSFRHANFLFLISYLSHRHKKAEIVLIKSPNFSDMYDDDEKQLIDSIEKDFKNISPVALPGSVMWHNAGCQVIARISEKASTRSLFISSSPCREAEETMILPMMSVFHLFIYKSKTVAWIRWGVRAIWRESRDDGASCLGMKITFSGLTLPRVCVQDRALRCLFYTWIFFRCLTRV